MSNANGHANGASSGPFAAPPAAPAASTPTALSPRFSLAKIKGLTTKLEVPFPASVIEWRVTNTSDKRGPLRGQVIPYADQRAYTDRLNELFTPAGWTREYQVHTSGTFQRSKDQKTAAKVFVTCQVTIYGLGSHSATGEEWTDDENAVTCAEAQSFKRACSCFGLGRYLYHFTGVWVDLDDRKRPKKTPQLFGWATPEGWQQGLRPPQQTGERKSDDAPTKPTAAGGVPPESGNTIALIREIEAMREPLGVALYRGLLKAVGNAWQPADIRDVTLLKKVLEHMQGAKRGLLRVDSALNTLGSGALQPVLCQLKIGSLAKVDSLATLKQIVEALEAAVGKAQK